MLSYVGPYYLLTLFLCPSRLLIHTACSALGNLAALDAANKQSIATAGGICSVLAAMRAHPTNPQLLERCCGVLFNLSFDHTNKELIADHGGVEAIIKAMNDWPKESGLQHYAVLCLWNLGGSVANKVRVHSDM